MQKKRHPDSHGKPRQTENGQGLDDKHGFASEERHLEGNLPEGKLLEEQAFEIERIEAFIRGDVAAFKYIYAKYRQRIFSYCLYITGDKTVAEDAFQEAFTRAYTRRDQLKEPKALKSWLLLITRSVCLNMLRTSKFTPDFVYLDEKAPDETEGPTHKELTSDPLDLGHGDALRTALQRLAPMYREAFLLREFEGYSYEEISEMTGASVMNVKVRITRAKKMLRKFLEPHYPSSTRGNNSKPVSASTDNATELHDAEDDDTAFEPDGPVVTRWA